MRKNKLAAKIDSLQKKARELAALRKKKLAAKIDSLQKKGNKRRGYAKGPLRNSKQEAHAVSSKAQKGATDSTGVVRGLAAVHRLDPRS